MGIGASINLFDFESFFLKCIGMQKKVDHFEAINILLIRKNTVSFREKSIFPRNVLLLDLIKWHRSTLKSGEICSKTTTSIFPRKGHIYLGSILLNLIYKGQ